MTIDLVKRLNEYADEVQSRINRGVVPFCHLGASVVGPVVKEAAARIVKLEGQREVDAGLMQGMRGIIKQLEAQLKDAHDAGFNEGIDRAAQWLRDCETNFKTQNCDLSGAHQAFSFDRSLTYCNAANHILELRKVTP